MVVLLFDDVVAVIHFAFSLKIASYDVLLAYKLIGSLSRFSLPNTARKAGSADPAVESATSYFSTSSCRLPNSARKAVSAVPAVGCHTLHAKLLQQLQL